jgi:hypothetical protein
VHRLRPSIQAGSPIRIRAPFSLQPLFLFGSGVPTAAPVLARTSVSTAPPCRRRSLKRPPLFCRILFVQIGWRGSPPANRTPANSLGTGDAKIAPKCLEFTPHRSHFRAGFSSVLPVPITKHYARSARTQASGHTLPYCGECRALCITAKLVADGRDGSRAADQLCRWRVWFSPDRCVLLCGASEARGQVRTHALQNMVVEPRPAGRIIRGLDLRNIAAASLRRLHNFKNRS